MYKPSIGGKKSSKWALWADSADDNFVIIFFFITKKTGFDSSCSRDNLHEMQIQGPVVQSVVSLTSSLRVISLTVLVDSIHNILIFFAEKCE